MPETGYERDRKNLIVWMVSWVVTTYQITLGSKKKPEGKLV